MTLLRKRWLSVAVLTALGVLGGVVASLATTPTYEARSQVFVSVQGSSDSASDLLQGSSFTVRQVKSYTELATSPRVLDPVVEELGLTDDAASLAERVRAESPMDTVLINVIATDESARLAASTADAVASSLADVVGELETPAAGGDSPVQISTVRSATVPTEPSSPDLRLNLALGLVVGLALGIGLAVVRELLDTRVRSAPDVEAVTDAPVLGAIGYEADAPEHPLIVQESPQALRAEAFRRLRTNLQFLDLGDGARTVVMTSALPGEGKTTTSINLAITLADAGQRVLLVDADLRRPAVARYMGIEGSVGLTTVLIGKVGLRDAVQPWGSSMLDVLAAGQIPPNPSELLGSETMTALVGRLGEEYDVVVVDSPPLLPVTDAAILARRAGGAILVSGVGTIHRQHVAGAVAALGTVGARLLGVVLNRVPLKGPGASAYGYSYYEYASEPAPTGRRRARPAHGSRRRPGPGRRGRSGAAASLPEQPLPARGQAGSRRAPELVPERVPVGTGPGGTASFDEVVAPREGR
ncbi:chromosome partitioning protein [Cellulosimicrobium sp. CUA-896]|nr:chromosome partitioning protein [Cellulosimicrobium sp. CUA-896]